MVLVTVLVRLIFVLVLMLLLVRMLMRVWVRMRLGVCVLELRREMVRLMRVLLVMLVMAVRIRRRRQLVRDPVGRPRISRVVFWWRRVHVFHRLIAVLEVPCVPTPIIVFGKRGNNRRVPPA